MFGSQNPGEAGFGKRKREQSYGVVYLNMEVEGTSIKWRSGLAVAVQGMRSGSRPEEPGEAGAGVNIGAPE